MRASLPVLTPQPTTITYQWFRDGIPIAGGNASNYELSQNDLSSEITLKIVANRTGYNQLTKTSSATQKIMNRFTSVGSVVILGLREIGQEISVDEGTWLPAPTSFSYQWYRNGVQIENATERSYLITTDDYETTLSVKVTALLANFYSESVNITSENAISGLIGELFTPNFLISDRDFYNGQSMNTSEIQGLLNSKMSFCEIGNGLASREPEAPYGNTVIADNCLAGFSQQTQDMSAVEGICSSYQGSNNESAASIIFKVGLACGISQKILLALIEKEQGLVTDPWPTQRQFDQATGFSCIENGQPCQIVSSGFFNQIWAAAKQLKKYGSAPFTWLPIGTQHSIAFSPNQACGSIAVTIANKATAALYYYSPYVPNSAALANLYGVGDSCSSYGIRNFWRTYSDWFGLPRS